MANRPADFFECCAGRESERLVQGVLRFLLMNDPAFRQEFCRWAGWQQQFNRFDEDVSEGDRRHDLLAKNSAGDRKRVELKLWARFTEGQRAAPGTIDLLILPETRLHEVKVMFGERTPRLKTLEDLEQLGQSTGGPPAMLLQGLGNYAATGNEVKIDRVLAEARAWKAGQASDGPSLTYAFLRKCLAEAEGLGLQRSTTSRFGGTQPYCGCYLISRPGGERCESVWMGFIFDSDAAGEITRHAFVLFAVDGALAEVSELNTRPASWYVWPSCTRGLALEPSGGAYRFDDWRACMLPILQRLAGERGLGTGGCGCPFGFAT